MWASHIPACDLKCHLHVWLELNSPVGLIIHSYFSISAQCKCLRWMHAWQFATSGLGQERPAFGAQRRLQIVLRIVLHCRQASYLVKQHVSFACRPPSTPAQMINLIQPCVAGLWLNPIMLWCFAVIDHPIFLCGFFYFICGVWWKISCSFHIHGTSSPQTLYNTVIDHVSISQSEYDWEILDLPRLNRRQLSNCFFTQA